MAGLGYDAAIMADTVDVLKDRMGWLAYVEAGIRKLPGKPVKATDQHRRQRARPPADPQRHGRQLRPDHGRRRNFPRRKSRRRRAGPADSVPAGRLGWLGVVAGIFGRNKNETESVEYFQGKTAEITLDHEQEFQLDGDHVGTGKHLAISIEPNALKILMTAPPSPDGAPGVKGSTAARSQWACRRRSCLGCWNCRLLNSGYPASSLPHLGASKGDPASLRQCHSVTATESSTGTPVSASTSAAMLAP